MNLKNLIEQRLTMATDQVFVSEIRTREEAEKLMKALVNSSPGRISSSTVLLHMNDEILCQPKDI